MICICEFKSLFMKLKTLILIPFMLTACGSDSNHSKVIYTSFAPVQELVSNIVGDKYEVKCLVPPGIEPHEYEISAKQMADLTDSKALFINGLGFEHWTNSLTKDIKAKTYEIGKNINEIRLIDGAIDPHVWLDPINAINEMEYITNTLSSLDDNDEYYHSNLNKYKEEFEQLDDELKAISDNFSQKNIVVSHAAFGYMCARYELNQIYINGISADEEPSSKALAEIIDKVNTLGITTIFTEELISPEIANKIASECHVKIGQLKTMEEIEEDEDYISIMKENFSKLEEACK